MKSNVTVPALIAAIVLAIVVIAVMAGRNSSKASGASDQIIVKPANPNDPKFRPNPALGLSGGGGG